MIDLSIIKTALTTAKKIGNIEVQQALIDVQQQMLDTQQELESLRKENSRLVDLSELEKKIERYEATIVTRSDDEQKIMYCSRCWDYERKLVQIYRGVSGMNGRYSKSQIFKCSVASCENTGIFGDADREIKAKTGVE